MPNPLSTYGLMMEGSDAARGVQQNYNLGQERIRAAQQQGQLNNQAIETGNMGLEDMRRTRDTASAVRNAGVSAMGQGKGITGSLLDMSDTAAQKGDMSSALQIRQLHQTLWQSGLVDAARAYVMSDQGTPDAPPSAPVPRPDLARFIHGATPDSVMADNKGNITLIDPQTKQPMKINAMQTLSVAGVIKPPTVHPIGASGALVTDQSGKITPVAPMVAKTTPEPDVRKEYMIKTDVDGDGRKVDHIIDLRAGSPTHGQEVAPSTFGLGGEGTNVRKDLTVLNDITKGITELGDEYGKTDMSNPLNPKITLTPKGQQAALVAEQIRLANQALAPRTIIELATKGKPMWKTENGVRTGVVLYNGQEFPMSTPSAKSVATKPSAKPAVAVSTPASAPPAAPVVPVPNPAPPVAAAEPAASEVNPRSVNNAFSLSGVQDQPGARAEFDKQRAAEKLRSTYKVIVGGARGKLYSQNDIEALQNVIEAGVLNKAEKERATQLLRASGAQGYAKGGKVTRQQCHGLG